MGLHTDFANTPSSSEAPHYVWVYEGRVSTTNNYDCKGNLKHPLFGCDLTEGVTGYGIKGGTSINEPAAKGHQWFYQKSLGIV
jgi:hypothetical protein